MTAEIMNGSGLAAKLREDLRTELAPFQASPPGLAVVLVGADPASAVYVKHKIRACEEVGIRSIHVSLPATATQEQIAAEIRRLNAARDVHGILVQLPLPSGMDTLAALAEIDPVKDVDGFGALNQGRLVSGLPGFRPCTPAGVMHMLQAGNVPLAGAHAVVLGRSLIVGKPLATLLLAADASVTVCHSRSADIGALTRLADILVVAVGRARMITADMVKPGATVIDVGINRVQQGALAGSLCGDVDFESVRRVAARLTPVPGGVGPMTIAMLLRNTVDAWHRQARGAHRG
ncbi:bifunctional methylenetetrahydrofolate dehydrogenase/methenyltetrahydrofolate cyclohydrolase FolD [Verticiella sediminum]|uniref:Bifunctional protein FolD n=1 Tax=Verticiella sediminum TaxID=1247510 RepID=A0A556A5X0_9BURK|nr:bifunctional methylenetetrahydrofolate dehydrogenase/methenyltetrahydrofolate cyclohydrolase FolD [Verticiella sediminum]TSH88285.1 bifunctional methylenetetrahydrofolate dehydrogenase/methenyltetrahydrofolate cyclohydrolase FolD [Verticiella sediminum]